MTTETLFDDPPDLARFDGPEPESDRLTGQLLRTWKVMSDHKWRTTTEIAAVTRDPVTSVSAQLRHLRKERFGAYLVETRKQGNRWEYQVGQKGEGIPQHVNCTHCRVLKGRIEIAVELVSSGLFTKDEVIAALRGYGEMQDQNFVLYGEGEPPV